MSARGKAPRLPPYNEGIAAALLGAREAVMAPIRPILREHQITEQQWRLLRVLLDIGPMEISQAAQASMIMAPSVTRILKDLTARELIVRTQDPIDKRRSRLTITRAGRTLVQQTARQTGALLAQYRTRFGDQRFAALLSELQEFQRTIKPEATDPDSTPAGSS